MHFRTTDSINHQSLFARPGEITVVVPTGSRPTVRIWQEQGSADGKAVARVQATTQIEVPDALMPEFDALILVKADHPRTEVNVDTPPTALGQFTSPIESELRAAARRVFEIVRWRYASDSPHYPFAGLPSKFRPDANEWLRLPQRMNLHMSVGRPARLDARAETAVQADLDAGRSESIAHSLLREARDVENANRRSALIIGVAAVETGLKRLAVQLLPQMEWLMHELSSPPVEKMIRDYLPTLPVALDFNGLVHPPPKRVRRLIHNAVEARNGIVHTGAGGLDFSVLRETLDAFEDVLYLFDYYAGVPWARDVISEEFAAELGT